MNPNVIVCIGGLIVFLIFLFGYWMGYEQCIINKDREERDNMRITGVAILEADTGVMFSLPEPNRHHNIIQMMAADGHKAGEQGFVTNAGTFLGRIGAMQLAIDSKQLKRRPGKMYYQGPELFSEDLW